MLVGILLVIIGIVFFAQALGFLDSEQVNVLWPLLLVVVGLGLMSHKTLGRWSEWFDDSKGRKKK